MNIEVKELNWVATKQDDHMVYNCEISSYIVEVSETEYWVLGRESCAGKLSYPSLDEAKKAIQAEHVEYVNEIFARIADYIK